MMFCTKSLIGGKPVRITLDEVDWFIIAYNRTKYLELFDSEFLESISISNKIR